MEELQLYYQMVFYLKMGQNNIKEGLFENCNLHTILRLPNSVFAHTLHLIRTFYLLKKKVLRKKLMAEYKIPKELKNYNKTRPIKKSDIMIFLNV